MVVVVELGEVVQAPFVEEEVVEVVVVEAVEGAAMEVPVLLVHMEEGGPIGPRPWGPSPEPICGPI